MCVCDLPAVGEPEALLEDTWVAKLVGQGVARLGRFLKGYADFRVSRVPPGVSRTVSSRALLSAFDRFPPKLASRLVKRRMPRCASVTGKKVRRLPRKLPWSTGQDFLDGPGFPQSAAQGPRKSGAADLPFGLREGRGA